MVSTGNGNIAVNINAAFQIFTIEDQAGDRVIETSAQSDDPVFMQGPLCEVGGEGSFTGAGNAKIDIKHMGMLGTQERLNEKDKINYSKANQ